MLPLYTSILRGITPAPQGFTLLSGLCKTISHIWTFAILIGISTVIINEGIKVSKPEPQENTVLLQDVKKYS